MAGGIQWFRWHHGSVTDPKFQLVAKKAGASLPDVMAVWVYLLEKASAAELRGCFGEIDGEAVDCLFGFEDGHTDAILCQLVERKLIAEEYVVAWEKRQPQRERTDDSSTERVRAFRQKQRTETPSNATERQETPRGEESREEDSVAKATGVPPAAKSEDETKRELFDAGKSLLAEQGMPAKQTGSFIGKLAKDYGQPYALDAVRSAVMARPMGAAEFLVATCQRLKGSRADPVTVPSGAADATTAYLAAQTARVHDPPPDLKAMLTKAKQSVGSQSLRAMA